LKHILSNARSQACVKETAEWADGIRLRPLETAITLRSRALTYPKNDYSSRGGAARCGGAALRPATVSDGLEVAPPTPRLMGIAEAHFAAKV